MNLMLAFIEEFERKMNALWCGVKNKELNSRESQNALYVLIFVLLFSCSRSRSRRGLLSSYFFYAL